MAFDRTALHVLTHRQNGWPLERNDLAIDQGQSQGLVHRSVRFVSPSSSTSRIIPLWLNRLGGFEYGYQQGVLGMMNP